MVLLLSLAEDLPFSPAAACSVLPRRPLLPAGDDEEAEDEQALLTVADIDLDDARCLLWLLLARWWLRRKWLPLPACGHCACVVGADELEGKPVSGLYQPSVLVASSPLMVLLLIPWVFRRLASIYGSI